MAYLERTTLYEIASLVDELEINDNIAFTTEDPDKLKYYDLQPCKYNLICKKNLLFESDYVIAIGLINGHCTVSKDIYILSNGNVDDEDDRIDGITEFLEEYYEKYMEKNKDGYVYLILD